MPPLPIPHWRTKSKPLSYALWFLCLIGLCGLHRIYLGRWISGVLWLVTGGLLLFGQIVDLFLIPRMVRIRNIEVQFIRRAVAQLEAEFRSTIQTRATRDPAA
jgi:TM2 domain-containing membrane protein YozV